jgi:hypothetical protein
MVILLDEEMSAGLKHTTIETVVRAALTQLGPQPSGACHDRKPHQPGSKKLTSVKKWQYPLTASGLNAGIITSRIWTGLG